MRVLHLGKYFYPYRGGIENFLLDLAVELDRNGIRSSVLAHQEKPFRPTQFGRFHGLDIIKACTLGQILYAPVAPSYGYHLARLIRRSKPDLLHLHVPNLSAFCLLALQKRPPYLIHWQADVVASVIDRRLRLFLPPYRLLERALLRNATAIIVTSHNYLEASRPLIPFRHKCHVVPLGLNPARLCLDEENRTTHLSTASPHPLTVLSAGRFAYYKGFEFLVEAARQVSEIRFIVVGEGPLRRKLLAKVKDLCLEDRVLLPGLLSDRELHALLASCDLFCLPSIERTESFGLVLLEAMAFGKPLITTDLEGSAVNWVNQHGITGLVVRPRDSQALAEAIRILQREPALRHAMGREAKQRLEEHFHIGKVTKKIISLYSSCQSGSSG